MLSLSRLRRKRTKDLNDRSSRLRHLADAKGRSVNSWPDYRALLACDIAASAHRGETHLQAIRTVLRSTLSGCFADAGLDEETFVRLDTGDGYYFVAPPGLPKARLLYPLLPELSTKIREHNLKSPPGTQLRVRVALHAGEIRFDSDGTVSGSPFETLARLLDSGPLRQATQDGASGTPVAAILSSHYYEETAVHGYEGLAADAFTAAQVQVKEYSGQAWLWYPGSPVGPRVEAGPDSARERPGEPGPHTAGQNVRVSGHGTAFVVQHGIQKIRHNDRG